MTLNKIFMTNLCFLLHWAVTYVELQLYYPWSPTDISAKYCCIPRLEGTMTLHFARIIDMYCQPPIPTKREQDFLIRHLSCSLHISHCRWEIIIKRNLVWLNILLELNQVPNILEVVYVWQQLLDQTLPPMPFLICSLLKVLFQASKES